MLSIQRNQFFLNGDLWLLLLYRNPYFKNCILGIRIDIDFNIWCVAIFITRSWEPFGKDTTLQFLNRSICTCSGENSPCGSRNDLYSWLLRLTVRSNPFSITPFPFLFYQLKSSYSSLFLHEKERFFLLPSTGFFASLGISQTGWILPRRVCARPRKVSVPAFRKCPILSLLPHKIYILLFIVIIESGSVAKSSDKWWWSNTPSSFFTKMLKDRAY